MGTPAERERLVALEDRLAAAIAAAKVGEFDGDEFGGGECVLYMYGPDADGLFSAIRAMLEAASLPAGSYAIRRWGEAADPNARQERTPLA
jgi:hypothetical protein